MKKRESVGVRHLFFSQKLWKTDHRRKTSLSELVKKIVKKNLRAKRGGMFSEFLCALCGLFVRFLSFTTLQNECEIKIFVQCSHLEKIFFIGRLLR